MAGKRAPRAKQRARASGGKILQVAGDYYCEGSGPEPTALATLPPRPEGFVGRDTYVRDIQASLDPKYICASDSPLMCVIAGLGGVGKTALALEIAHRAIDQEWFSGGALFLDLRGYEANPVTADQAVLSLLRALGLREIEIPTTADEQYASYRTELSRRRAVLLVLDNASDPAQVTPLLPGAGSHKVLLTSCESLDSIPARQIHLPALEPEAAVAAINEALQISDPFDDRAASEPRAAHDLAMLCGCLPLALQIAAAQLRRRRKRPIAELVHDLSAEADLPGALRANGVDQYGKPLVLHPVFDLSYRRLEADQARLFRLLAVGFGPDIGSEAASALVSLPETQVLRLLDDLAATYLITSTPDRNVSGHGRCHMLDLVRAYALALVTEGGALSPEGLIARKLLLDHYAATASAASSALRGHEPTPSRFAGPDEALDWFEDERANLVGAALWAEGSSTTVVRLAVSLNKFLYQYRYFDDLISVNKAALHRTRRLNGADSATLRDHLGRALIEVRRFEEAIICHRNSLKINKHTKNHSSSGVDWNNIGLAMQGMYRFEEAISAHKRALKIHQENGNRKSEALAWDNIGCALVETGKSDAAVTAHRSAMDIHRELGDRHGEGRSLGNLGLALMEVRHFEEAIAVYERARNLFQEGGHRADEGKAWNNLGNALREVRRFQEAVTALRHSLRICQEIGDRHGEGEVSDNLGNALQKVRRRVGEAVAAHEHALQIYQEAGDRLGEGDVWNNLGNALQKARRVEEAIAAHEHALQIFQEAGDAQRTGGAWGNLGVDLWKARRLKEALSANEHALQIFQQAGVRHSEGAAWNNIGLILRASGNFNEGIVAFERAREILEETGDWRAAVKARSYAWNTHQRTRWRRLTFRKTPSLISRIPPRSK
ncbi:ATP-binding protein [Streptomyces mirabilis]|uniref:ATP-binding protein n=1 Tax=Streptomyces mirabilis TaxID=68239 RepID=UPI0033D3FEAA